VQPLHHAREGRDPSRLTRPALYIPHMALEDELAKLTRRRRGVGRPPGQGRGVAFGFAAIGLGLLVLVLGLIALSSLARTGPNEVGVVYNGGPLDKKTQRQFIPPASGLTWTGWLSQDPRLYPSEGSPRRYIITSDPGRGDRVGVDELRIPTADGIDVGLEAKISFTTGFTGQPGDQLLRQFDARFGNRTYPVPGGGQRLHPWEGDDGFGAFLDTEFRPVLDNALRETIGRFRCDELVSSCALLSNKGGSLDQKSGAKTNANLVAVQQAIGGALNDDLSSNLGGKYFRNVQVVVSAVRLPERVQDAVNDAQAQFAEVNKANADLQKARIRKKVNDTLGRSYDNCPACAEIDALKSIPSNVTAISLGGGGSLALNANKK
jgi:regulator of protease activity HflC (stomatin/prohibitin superfamily)